MNKQSLTSTIIFALAIIVASLLLKQGVVEFKTLDRSVAVKGLAEKEVMANTVIWPINYSLAGNDLTKLIDELEAKNQAVRAFLALHGFSDEEISVSPPNVADKLAQPYAQLEKGQMRYFVMSSITVYSHEPEKVRHALTKVTQLAKQGIAISSDRYDAKVQYIFTGLNDIKPEMIQQATEKAREVAEKFATDSKSTLGKIKSARQGQFSISDRDSNSPHIKRVRVVSSVEYYLVD
ncbi:SIMPL domain-containing protein [Pseudoalteromonas sp. MMG024]|uniref:SIMPL domain-containing protein n=1 Tax=Pseudoalteromonas sp. MMG024 TaxID=2909980 RepID=UPI001F1B1C80|nr:SIMPL domain-containing protein [Pseudoalteromonas sp. MMG024]MCF6457727.1 SIMPL domain-containing protein [Pseudoalteromonas sp. MMG024]